MMDNEMPPHVQKFAGLLSELQIRWPQLAKDTVIAAKESVILELCSAHEIPEQEYWDRVVVSLDRQIQVLRNLPPSSQ